MYYVLEKIQVEFICRKVMMEEFVLDDEKYYYRDGKWFTSSRTAAPLAVVSKLNKLLVEHEDFETKTMDELLAMIDGARAVANNQLAAQALEEALRRASEDEIRLILPRLASNYRRVGRPRAAIDICKSYTDHYGKKVWSPALFTSIAAAYCDIDDYDTALNYANRARAISGQESGVELMNVYSRIKNKK